jgi:hypothetical protein
MKTLKLNDDFREIVGTTWVMMRHSEWVNSKMCGKFQSVEWTVYERGQAANAAHTTGWFRIKGRTIKLAVERFEKIARGMNEIGPALLRAAMYEKTSNA